MIVSTDLEDFLAYNAGLCGQKSENTEDCCDLDENAVRASQSGRSSFCSENTLLSSESMGDLIPDFSDSATKERIAAALASDEQFLSQGHSMQLEPRQAVTILHVNNIHWDNGIHAEVEPEKGCSFSVFVTHLDPAAVQHKRCDGQNFTCSQFGSLAINNSLARQFGANNPAVCHRLKDMLIDMCGTICAKLRHQVAQAYSVEVYVCTSDSSKVSSSLVVNVKAWEATTACIIGSETVQAVLALK
jgi:hypothetical protein